MDVFHRPGDCDLTTNVDFTFIQEAMGDLGTRYLFIIIGNLLTRHVLQLRLTDP